MSRRIACVVAHYHVSGLLGPSTRGLLGYLQRHTDRVVLVSTHLAEDEARTVPPGVQVIVRPNEGYDFYSYKIGLASIEDLDSYDYVFIMNNSFVCLDPDKLISRVLARLDGSTDVLGLTGSKEITPHIQSYFIVFSKKTISSVAVRGWWDALVPVSDRAGVIARYELGLSAFLLAHGYTLGYAFDPSPTARLRALRHAIELGIYQPVLSPDSKVNIDLQIADQLNPTHFAWQELLDQFGVVKRELFEKNPFRLDLRELHEAYGDRLATL